MRSLQHFLQSRMRNERAIISFKVDQWDKPIKRNRVTICQFSRRKGSWTERRSGKALPPWFPHIRHDQTHKFQKSKTSLAPMRICGASKADKKIHDGSTYCMYVCIMYVCMYIRTYIRMYVCTCTEFLLVGSPMVTIATVQTRWPTASGFGWLCDAAAVRI